jgi:putative nucleotidyltransferase with HDIG domain
MRANGINRFFSKNKWLRILCVLGSFALCCVIVLVSNAPETHNIQEGEISPETITAPRDFVDDVATSALQEEERAKIGPVYNLNTSITQESLDALAADFEKFESARAYAQQYYVNAQIAALQAAENQRVQTEIDNIKNSDSTEPAATPTAKVITAADVPFDPSTIDWKTYLPAEEQTEIQGVLPPYVNDTDWVPVVSMTKDELNTLFNLVYSISEEELDTGFKEEDVDDVASQIVLQISEQYDLSAPESRLLTECLQYDLKANIVFDQEATRLKQDEAAAAVDPVTYMKGQNIVMKGEVVTPDQYSVLDRMGLLDQPNSSLDYSLAAVLYVTLLFAIYIIYVLNFEKKLAENIKHIAILSILTVLVMAVTGILARIAPDILITTMAAILVAVLVSTKNAVSYTVFISLLIVTVLTGKHAFFTDVAFETVIISVLGGILAIVVLRKKAFRAAPILAGLVACIPGVLLQIVLWKENLLATASLFPGMAWLLASGVLSGVVAIGLLPPFESLFKITTPAKLLELSDPNHPLLKRLLLEAPGTYHHSLFVGNLAEAGCEAVGANSLLARVGSYYHDVGKLKNPMYFVENQRNNVNPHDKIRPEQSAEIIMSHVTSGYEMLGKYNIPSEIKKIQLQHHGNTPVAFFYHKAKQEDGKADINDYRYPCPRPDTIESAIVMLADTVEAAMRTLDDPTEEETFEFIKKLIQAKYDDGQLDLTPLTRRDLTAIARAFAGVYNGMLHNRIKYPRLELDGEKDEDSHM